MHNKKPNQQRRREFLRKCIKYSVAGASAAGAVGNLGLMQAMAADTGGYKALVCLFLHGGNDSFNMVVPYDDASYAEYLRSRQTMAVPREQLLPVNPASTLASDFAFNAGMPEAQQLFETGKLAVLANVGALIEPTSKADYVHKRVALPPRLFSHIDQQNFWEQLNVETSVPSGWAGRMADLLHTSNANQRLSMNIALTGNAMMLTGMHTLPYYLSPDGAVRLHGFDSNSAYAQERRRAVAYDAILSNPTGHVFSDEFARLQRRAIDLSVELNETFSNFTPLNTPVPAANDLANALQSVAQMIAVRDALGFSRQVFFIGFGGWDTHADQMYRHTQLLSTLSEALQYFYQATVELGVSNEVTTFTSSEFGRTLTTNSDGTDHGWGSHQLIMGDAVSGGDIYGEMPSLEIDGPQDSGRGRVIPTTSVDQYYAALASWFGLTSLEAREILPNLSNFNPSDLGLFS